MRPRGGLGPCPRWSHGYSKAGCKHGDWYFPPPHILYHYNNNVRGSPMFFLSAAAVSPGRTKSSPATVAATKGWGEWEGGRGHRVTLPPWSLSFVFSLNVNYSDSHFSGWPGAHWLMGKRAIFCPVSDSHHSVFTLNLWPPDLNSISDRLSVFGWAGVDSECLFYLKTHPNTHTHTRTQCFRAYQRFYQT